MVTFFHKTYLNGYSTGVTRHGKVDSKKRKKLEARRITSVLIVKKREKRVYFYHKKKRKESVVIHLHVEGVRTPKLLWNPI